MRSKDSEYTSLREEIIGLVNIQNNYIIAMYTITIAIISLAFQQVNEWLFLLPYVTLFSFQRIIAAKKDIMLRIAAYIVVFLEKDQKYGWEKNYGNIVKFTTEKNNSRNKFSSFLNVASGRIASLQLGFICSAFCIGMNIWKINLRHEFDGFADAINFIDEISFKDLLPSMISLVLLFCLRQWCKGALNSMETRNKYIESLASGDINSIDKSQSDS